MLRQVRHSTLPQQRDPVHLRPRSSATLSQARCLYDASQHVGQVSCYAVVGPVPLRRCTIAQHRPGVLLLRRRRRPGDSTTMHHCVAYARRSTARRLQARCIYVDTPYITVGQPFCYASVGSMPLRCSAKLPQAMLRQVCHHSAALLQSRRLNSALLTVDLTLS